MMSSHLMLVPSLACPASCAYCFGPHTGGPPMSHQTLEAIVQWQSALGNNEPLEVTFHGGEPLVPGAAFYRTALPLLRNGLARRDVRFGVQSNLWLLTDDLCELFREYGVSLGTSLDGPEQINDAQRGAGYFRRTMAGIERARSHGLGVGCICTFTAQSARRADEVFDFFVREALGFSIHAALPPLGQSGNGWALSPEAHGQLLVDMLDRYLDNATTSRISTLDAMCRSISTGQGSVCTFDDCLGRYLALDPEGWIYSCQRFAGTPQFRLGIVHDCPTLEDLAAAPFWQALQDRQERIEEECDDCSHLDFCRGGCPYNVLATNGGRFGSALRDPHCPAYRRAFSVMTDRALEEVFSEENLTAVVEEGASKHGLMRKGRLLHMMRGGPHPQQAARQAREVVAAVALAVSESPEEALHKLDLAGIVTRPEQALQSLTALRERLDAHSRGGLVNAYLHVTHNCNLRCSHCYANASPGQSMTMAVSDVTRLVQESAEAGFGKVVITGGEPMMHPQCCALLDALVGLREEVKPLQIVLRTNLAYLLDPALLERLTRSTDHVVISIDGDETTHDARRGAGTYARTAENLRALLEAHPRTEVSITAVLTADEIGGPEGSAVRLLGEQLGVRVRFKPTLPLGRAADLGLALAFYSSLHDGFEMVACGTQIAATCGLGMNLYVGPDGACYPCYALMGQQYALGNALDDGLPSVLHQNDAYRRITVDSNQQCRACALRYVCGGYCRAWRIEDHPNAPPSDCSVLHARARTQLLSALEVLDIQVETWVAAGLPLPVTTAKVS